MDQHPSSNITVVKLLIELDLSLLTHCYNTIDRQQHRIVRFILTPNLQKIITADTLFIGCESG